MKTIEKLRTTPRLLTKVIAEDGGCGIIAMPKWTGTVIWSFGGGWEHVSVAPMKKHITPSWDDMCRIKDMFFNDDEWVVQFHPAKSEYVNNMPNCLHLWRPLYENLPTPPSWMTGVKVGETLNTTFKAAEEALAHTEEGNQ